MDKDFRENYEAFFIERFVFSTAELEELANSECHKRLKEDIYMAYMYLLGEKDNLNIGIVRNVGNLVNQGYNVPLGFRKIDVTAGSKAHFEPSKPINIINDINNLLYNYYFMWKDLDVFLKEAMFHIKFMRIHPFEDGNKRSAKLLTTTNLCKQGLPPIIITKEDTDEYYRFINECDYDGFAEFLKQRSNLENNTMCGFFRIINGVSMYDDVDIKAIQKIVKL